MARVGLDDAELQEIADRDDVVKVSPRDLAVVAARGGYGATTVASTAYLASRAGIAVFATGGLGGVHRGASATYDESADLMALARVGTTVVCAGVKSILDVPVDPRAARDVRRRPRRLPDQRLPGLLPEPTPATR